MIDAVASDSSNTESNEKPRRTRRTRMTGAERRQQLLEKQRYNDAADAFAAFPTRHPTHALAPTFQTAVIGAYRTGGFADLI